MPTETVQLLCTAFPKERLERVDVPHRVNGQPYKHFNPKHPCSIWVRESYQNFVWTVTHAQALALEYQRLYKRVHGVSQILNWICMVGDKEMRYNMPSKGMTPFALAMPDKYKDVNPHTAYQKYLVGEKTHYAKWASIKEIPWWWPDKTENSVDKSFVDGIYTKR